MQTPQGTLAARACGPRHQPGSPPRPLGAGAGAACVGGTEGGRAIDTRVIAHKDMQPTGVHSPTVAPRLVALAPP
jgi:hypothetical protein